MRRLNIRHFSFVAFLVFALLFFCEFLVYYLVLWSCHYPDFGQGEAAHHQADDQTLRAMFVADTHLLGSRQGHWWDKLRREWQMKRAFQTAMTYFSPEVIFFLGDVFDEGKWCDESEFNAYRSRFSQLFATRDDQRVVVVAGNHDIGFHYALTPQLNSRFQKSFQIPESGVELLTLKGNHFVLVNSMAMHGDKCSFCNQAEVAIKKVSRDLNCMEHSDTCDLQYPDPYSRPILLQHFPLYRLSDEDCKESDGAVGDEKTKPFRPLWDCLSESSSKFLLDSLKPRLVMSGHTHHGCRTVHKLSSVVGSDDDGNVPEWSVSSFSWRNRNDPTFVLAQIRPHEFVLNKCYMPEEDTVIFVYKVCGFLIFVYALLTRRKFVRRF